MFKLTKALVASTIIAGAVFAAPVAANAADYTPPTTPVISGGNGSSTVAPGGTLTIGYGAGTFTAGGAVNVTFSSAGATPTNGVVTPATFVAAQTTASGSAGSTGAATLTATVPADATASIEVTALDVATGHTISSTIAVAAAGAGSASLTAADPSGLAHTGTYISLATIWGAVGLVAVGAGFIAIRTMSRRKQAESGAHTA